MKIKFVKDGQFVLVSPNQQQRLVNYFTGTVVDALVESNGYDEAVLTFQNGDKIVAKDDVFEKLDLTATPEDAIIPQEQETVFERLTG